MRKFLAFLLLLVLPVVAMRADGENEGEPPKKRERRRYVYKDKWLFLEDELLLAPGYFSTALFPLKVGASLLTLSLLFENSHREAKGTRDISVAAKDPDSGEEKIVTAKINYSTSTKRSFLSMRKGVRSFFKGIFGKGELSSIFSYALMAAGAFVGYRLADWTIETFLYAHRLRGFLRHFPEMYEEKTPKVFREFFRYHHEKSRDSETLYVLKNTRKIIALIKKAVALHKKGMKLKEIPDHYY